MSDKEGIGKWIAISGALACLLLVFAWIGNAMYWQHVTGSWLDHHITDYEVAPLALLGGALVFTRVAEWLER